MICIANQAVDMYIVNFSTVKVYAKCGTEFGVISTNNGVLEIICRNPGEEWPHGLKPLPESENKLAVGSRYFSVIMEKE